MLPGHKYSLDEVLRVLWTRKWLVLLPLALGLATVPPLARRFPELYRSETLIMVVPQRIPDSYVKSTVTAKVEDRLPSINEQILSRSRLERIITDFGLYASQRASGIMEDIVQRMRADIEVKLEGKESFRVSYANPEPRVAQQVTERLASLYIEENLRDRETLAEGTNVFIESQLQDAKQRLLEHEKKLEAYRRRYAGQLPSQLESNLQVIQNAQMQLQSVSESVNRSRERRLLVERQLADAQVLPLATAAAPAMVLNSPDAIAATPAQQLEAARARLELYKTRYTQDHPDIRALEQTVRDLQARVDADAQRAKEPGNGQPVSPTEAAQQKRIHDLRAELEVIDHQIAAGGGEQTRLRNLIADYQAKVDAVPTRESELVELTRDYSTLQETYSSLLAKREESKLAANLERRQIGEQFKILDPASLPERPYNQAKRYTLTSAGAVGGLALGLALLVVGEYRDLTFKRESDVLRVLELPVLGLVPRIGPARKRPARRRVVAALVLMTLLVGSAVAFAVWRLQP